MASRTLLVLLAAALPSAWASTGLRGEGNATAAGNSTAASAVKALSLAQAAGCTAQDEAQMAKLGGGNADGTFPKYLAVCGKKNYNIFFGFNQRNFISCVQGDTGISSSCASCFAGSAKYGADNCKWSCAWDSFGYAFLAQ